MENLVLYFSTRRFTRWLVPFSVLLMAGCDFNFKTLLNRVTQYGARPTSSPPNPVSTGVQSSPAKLAQAHAELFREMYREVLVRDPKSRAEFGSWVDSLNQGASLEGVYNGLVHSAEYRRLEVANSGAAPKMLTLFGIELRELELALPHATHFRESDSQPLPLPVAPGTSTGATNNESPESSPVLSPEEYSRLFVGASPFTLKRILGDEALKVVNFQSEYRQKLADWYSKWAVRLADYKVDFGLELRNKRDVHFHFDWAVNASEDRIKWEVLNRIHRLMNFTKGGTE